jgi:hypothetical protein
MLETRTTEREAYSEIAEIANENGMGWSEAYLLYVSPVRWMQAKMNQLRAEQLERDVMEFLRGTE